VVLPAFSRKYRQCAITAPNKFLSEITFLSPFQRDGSRGPLCDLAQNNPSDVQNPPNGYAGLLTRVASGSSQCPALEKQPDEVCEMTLQTIKASVLKFAKDEDGLTIVEYAVAGGLITVLVAAAFVLLGGAVNTKIRALCQAVNGNVAC
jgi:pilus assembly protein Flp/PilA